MPKRKQPAKKSSKPAKKKSAPTRALNTFSAKLLGTQDKDLNPNTTIGPRGAKRLKKGLEPGSGFLFKKRKPAKKKAPPKKK